MIKSKLIAHRGIFDNETIIENTIPSFQKAFQYHYPIELDVQLTKDNQIIVFHDEDLSRMTGENLMVQEMDYSDLKKKSLLGTKARIPLLREVLELNQDQEYIDIEIKPTKRIYDTIFYLMKELNGYHQYVLKSFDPRLIRTIKKQYPDVQAGLLIHNKYDKWFYQWICHTSFILHYSKCDFVAISKKLLSNAKMMKKFSSYPIFVWTIKEKEEVNYQDHLTYICNNLPYPQQKDS